MATFIMISRHSPENCPAFNAKAKKAMMEYMGKEKELMKKYGVKELGGWFVPTEHLTFGVFEAPSLDAFMKFGMEPAVMALSEFETYEIKVAMSMEEATKMMK